MMREKLEFQRSSVNFYDGCCSINYTKSEDLVTMNPINTVFDAKHLIGRRFFNASIQSEEHYCYSACLTKDAGVIAGLDLMHIINEPTTAEIHPSNAATKGIETQKKNTHNNHKKKKKKKPQMAHRKCRNL